MKLLRDLKIPPESIGSVNEDDAGELQLKDQTLKDSNKQRQDFLKAANHFCDALITMLKTTFPDSKINECFAIFSPKAMTSFDDNGTPTMHLNTLLEHYQTKYFNPDEVLEEWESLHYILKQNRYHHLDMAGFMLAFLHDARETYPNLSRLCAIGLSIPLTSVSCERGISSYNFIKDAHRSNMHVTHANTLMAILVEGPRVSEFDFARAFDKWIEMKHRTGFFKMGK